MMDFISSGINIFSHGLFDGLMGILGSTLISLAGLFMMLASTVFELLLNATVIGFGATLTDYGILEGVRLVWSAFRDLGNIVIIGMFVFVAISMILGNTTYGTKKFVARILVVAVLINFSLLFTQLVVDASHIAATQFYKGLRAAAINNRVVFSEVEQSSAGQAGDLIWTQGGGVAGAFRNKMGAASFNDTALLIAKISNNGLSGMVKALFFSFAAMGLIIAAAAVFLYGAYLLAARALLLIVILATSSLAFAAWLVPKYGEGQYGWNGWLNALIQNAVLAPLLMMLLWASIVILSKAPTGSMGRFLSDPKTADPVQATAAIVVYLFTLGMLFLSFKIASSFSHKITGFNIAAAALGIGGRWAGGALGFTGKFAAKRAYRFGGLTKEKAEQRAEYMAGGGRYRDSTDVSGKISKALTMLTGQALKRIPNASFNPSRIPEAFSEKYKDVVKRYGLDTQGKGGFAAAEQRAEKAAEEKARKENEASDKRARVSKEERKKMIQEAFSSSPQADRDAYKQNLSTQRKSLEKLEQIRQASEDFRKQTAGRNLSSAEQEKQKKFNADLQTEQKRIEDARSAIVSFEKSIKTKVDGGKDEKTGKTITGTAEYLKERKEAAEYLARFGTDDAARIANEERRAQDVKRRRAAEALQDVHKLAGEGEKKKEEQTNTKPDSRTKTS